MWTWRSAYPHKPVEGHSGPVGSGAVGNVQVPVGPASFVVGLALVAGSEIASRMPQLLPSGSPMDVVPPQVQSPEQPGTCFVPSLQLLRLGANSPKPMQ